MQCSFYLLYQFVLFFITEDYCKLWIRTLIFIIVTTAITFGAQNFKTNLLLLVMKLAYRQIQYLILSTLEHTHCTHEPIDY